MNHSAIITATQNWLTSFIISYNICPFAKQVHDHNRIRYQVQDSDKPEACLEALIAECRHLDDQPAVATTLLILPTACVAFDDFLDLLAIAEQLLVEQGYEGIYQLASFHPDYCFADSNQDDPANYTNRSLYPMWHIIREADLERVLQDYQHPELIPERNIKLTRDMGLAKIQALLVACKK